MNSLLLITIVVLHRIAIVTHVRVVRMLQAHLVVTELPVRYLRYVVVVVQHQAHVIHVSQLLPVLQAEVVLVPVMIVDIMVVLHVVLIAELIVWMVIVQWLNPVLLQVLLQALVPVHVMLIHGVDVVTNVWEMVLHKSFHIIMLFLSLMKGWG